MRGQRVKYLLVQTAIGDYRQSVLEKIVEDLGADFSVLCGEEYFEPSTKTRVKLGSSLKFIRNRFLFGRNFVIQFGAVFPAVRAERVMLEMNPRIINVWLVLLARLLFNRKTVLWGHAWPRAGKNARSDLLRHLLRKLASHIVVYTDTQKAELDRHMKAVSVSSAPNALYSVKEMWVPDLPRENFIYVGRLVSKKKPQLMLKAYANLIKENDVGRLIVVGDGPERQHCESLACELGISEKVDFLGHVSDVQSLRSIYATCIASLSPGYVGLSITQSFSFGTPMIVADDEPHSPEIESAIGGENSIFFKANDEEDLSCKMLAVYKDRLRWKNREGFIISDCKRRYSSELMSQRLIEAFDLCWS